MFAKKPTSDHIQVNAFPIARKAGELCVFGSLTGISDYNTDAGAQGTVNVGKQIAVFQLARTVVTNPAIGMDIFVTTTGAFATTATGNKLFGTVVAIGHDTIDVAITG
jgi:predicted RecA/RadA family phage recombinase